jgi:RNA polymerase sigma-70 factor (ECF subfamily)
LAGFWLDFGKTLTMRFRLSPIRFSAERDGGQEAGKARLAAAGGGGAGASGSEGPGAGAPGSGVPGSGAFGKNPEGDGKNVSNRAFESAENKDSRPETEDSARESAQQSVENGVPEDMATLVMDNPGVGAGSGAGQGFVDARPVASESAERTDAEIMLAVAAGDEAGYNYLVTKYNRQIIHFLFRMVHNEAVAEELAQEVFLRVYRSRESYRAEAKFSTWLYRIATNLAVNHARDTRHERMAQTLELDAPDAESGSTPEVADDDLNIEQRMLREERMQAIRAQVQALPERQRLAVLMHKYQEMDYRQIGDVLKLSESATKSLLFRAYQTLRERLKDFV